VLLTTVGPYRRYGEPVVRACVEAATDYVDITGEPDFVADVVAKYDERARAAGIRVVSCCGFDSIPHDLGVYYTVRSLPVDRPIKVEGFVRASGLPSGGTWQSAIEAFANARNMRRPRGPKKGTNGGRRVRGASGMIRYEPRLDAFACPLPTIDPQIVLRSGRALSEYGPDFRYGHFALVKSPLTLAAGLFGVSALFALAQVGPTRELLRKVRASGEGPSEERRSRSFFQVTFLAEAGDVSLCTRVSGKDPGYDETAKMVAESALCLALDRDRLPSFTGTLTPAVAMGDALLERLVRAKIRFETLPAP
jgi:short subunit dehydrogenase-like uncharacterized protein